MGLAGAFPEAARATWEASIHRCQLRWILRIENGFDEILKDTNKEGEIDEKDRSADHVLIDKKGQEKKMDSQVAAVASTSRSTKDNPFECTKNFVETVLPFLETLRVFLKGSKYSQMEELLTKPVLRDLMDKGGDLEFLECTLSLQDVLQIVAHNYASFVEH